MLAQGSYLAAVLRRRCSVHRQACLRTVACRHGACAACHHYITSVLSSNLLHHLLPADMAHALHPNYADKHDPDLAPRLGSGLVLKHNVNQRYATTSISATLFR